MNALRNLILRLWNSPTFTTWLSFLTRALGLLLLNPIVLNRFSQQEITVWYLLLTLIGLQMLADFGFSPSFSRAIAYALGGAEKLENVQRLRTVAAAGAEPNWALFSAVLATMRRIYAWLSLAAVGLLAVFGTAALWKPISQLQQSSGAWAAWVCVLAATFVTFRGNFLVSYLQGINQIAILRRWEALWTSAGLLLAATVAWLGGSLLAVILCSQIFSVVNVLWNWRVAQNTLEGRLRESARAPFSREVFDAVWPAAWRSGLGVFMSNGVIQASSLVYAQIGPVNELASFLLAMRLITALVQFCQAPFYSKIPVMARNYAQGNREEVVQTARRGMRMAYAVYLVGVLFVGFSATPLLQLIHSKTAFVSPSVWAAMAVAFFVERLGAMNMQLYSLCNHIVWHIANGVTGVVYIGLCLVLVPHWGLIGFPVSMALAYLACYTTYALRIAHRLFLLPGLRHEFSTGALPTAAALLLLLAATYLHFASPAGVALTLK